ncbi:MAG: carbamoyl-phosphate synthase large subunit [Alphaproteobacteria bacterium]|nr:carbamoyl-phosphate synthase large subunit [Alphaproteobacteria bacterium]
MFKKILIANRGEVAVRVARAAAELGVPTVTVYSVDDAESAHVTAGDTAVALGGAGPSAYLNADNILAIAAEQGCDAIHPGYGFLSENASFAAGCKAAGICFIGPNVEALNVFGDKGQARQIALKCDVPVPQGTDGAVTLEEAKVFFKSLGKNAAVMVKSIAGGGGRGMRPAQSLEELEQAFEICRAEAELAFGSGDLYLEQLVQRARHIEVQIVGDAHGHVVALGDRDCSAQRRRQKLIEIAPAPDLPDDIRAAMHEASVRLAKEAGYDNVGTVEFLYNLDETDPSRAVLFMEANPRLQVEHTITEETTGVDLVQAQIRLASGGTLKEAGCSPAPETKGAAIQIRINAETTAPDGQVRPSGGTLNSFYPPGGTGVRVDTFAYPGMTLSPAFDSLLAKLIVRGQDMEIAGRRAQRALKEFGISGVPTNKVDMLALLEQPELLSGQLDTQFVERERERLNAAADRLAETAEASPVVTAAADGARETARTAPAGQVSVPAPLSGLVVRVDVAEGDEVWPGKPVALVEAMKMQHVVEATESGIVREILLEAGAVLSEGLPILFVEPAEVEADAAAADAEIDPDHIREDLAHVQERIGMTLDAARPEAVQKRHKTGMRTARENLDDLFDAGTFHEYGGLAIAAQRRRRSLEDLMKNTPADGLIGGVGEVNNHLFGPELTRCMGISYDYTVLAGTQGYLNHKKTDRLIELAHDQDLPIVLFAEGGGGRPGDVDAVTASGLDVSTFRNFAALSGSQPRIGIAAGRCFAGNAVLFGCCDITIATRNSNIGLGGPAMIEGGGLGSFKPEDIGPIDVQSVNGVVDLAVEDEAEAVAKTRQILGYFQGNVPDWKAPDQRLLRHAIPEDRLRVYDIRKVIDLLADEGSVVELRREFGVGIVTAFARIEGRAVGLMANDPKWLGGAIDSEAADKAAHFMQLCDAYNLPIVSLCDTPGFMVGPDSEKTASVRHGARMFIVSAALSVPVYTVVLRKGYGLGAQAMASGGFHSTAMTISWPSGEFGGMGLEGAVKLAYRKELEAIEDPVKREEKYAQKVAQLYEVGRATAVAQYLEIDAVIDPADTRAWLMRGLKMRPPERKRNGRRYIDTW